MKLTMTLKEYETLKFLTEKNGEQLTDPEWDIFGTTILILVIVNVVKRDSEYIAAGSYSLTALGRRLLHSKNNNSLFVQSPEPYELLWNNKR